MNVDFTNLTVMLIWLAGAGGPYVAGRVVALLAENWARWHALPKSVKVLAPMIVSVGLALLATFLLDQQAFLAQASPTFTLIMTALLGYLGTQDGYMAARRSDYGAKARTEKKN